MNDTAMEGLLAKQQIRDTLCSYCRGLDRMDRDLARSVFHPQATAFYHDMYEGTGYGFIDWVWQAHEFMERHSHQITNVITAVDGNCATSEAYVTVVLWTLADETGARTEIVARGRYLDRWVKEQGRWLISDREHVLDMHSEYPLNAGPVGPASRRDSADPSYGFL